MSDFLFGNDIVTAIQRSLSQAKKADFAVAYWGKGAKKRIGLDKIGIPVRILCDLTSGFCNPFELEKLLRPGVELGSKAGLHAKVYITPHRVITGSANASINGLGDEGNDSNLNLEAAVECSEEKVVADAAKWFENHRKEAEPIDKNRLEQIKPLWRLRSKSLDLLSLLARSPDSLREVPIRLAVFKSLNDAEDAEYADARTKVGCEWIYIDRTSSFRIMPGDYIISYWVKPSGRKNKSFKISDLGGVLRVKGFKPIKGQTGRELKVIVADKTNSVNGLKLSDADYKKLERCVLNYFQRNATKFQRDANSSPKNDRLMDRPLSNLPKEIVAGLQKMKG